MMDFPPPSPPAEVRYDFRGIPLFGNQSFSIERVEEFYANFYYSNIIEMEILEYVGTSSTSDLISIYLTRIKDKKFNSGREIISPVKFVFPRRKIEIGDKITIALKAWDSSYSPHYGGFDIEVLSWDPD